MRLIRLHVEVPLKAGAAVLLDERASHYLTRVLRLGRGDKLTLINDSGVEYAAELSVPRHAGSEVIVREATPIERESPLVITLVQSLLRTEKMAQVLQKSCELGVARIVPVISERTEVKLNEEREDKRLKHFREVLISAVEQCGRTRVPALEGLTKLETLARPDGVGLVLDPTARATLRTLDPMTSASVVVGPEGGFSDGELDRLARRGFQRVRLGPRILRTETAGPAAIAALQALFGDG
jgi:16S rRNA (uracil1498-N3)-methyltransferase